MIPSRAEEKAVSREPAKLVQELSRQKAAEVYESLSRKDKQESLIIGADTVVAVDGQILGKPKTEEKAFQMLKTLQGRSHHVYTGVTIIWQEGTVTFSEDTLVTLYPMSAGEIKDYIATGEPMDKAGAYGIQGAFAAWISKIDGDYNNVVGLPVGRVYQELKKINSGKGTEEHD